jgi:hypothetical protein
MIRSLLKIVLVVIIVLVGVGAFLAGRWSTNANVHPDSPGGTSGSVDTSKARDLGGKIGESTAKAANQAVDVIAQSAVTAKIKSKMVLDDLVKVRNIHVETNGTVVTRASSILRLSGNVLWSLRRKPKESYRSSTISGCVKPR